MGSQYSARSGAFDGVVARRLEGPGAMIAAMREGTRSL
jgi:hypothetical protein